jgi:putative flippase GtrA
LKVLLSIPRAGTVRQLICFVLIGLCSTAAYLALYTLLRGALSAQLANALALLVTAVANTAANRRFTFGIGGRDRVARHQLQGLAVFLLGLALTSGTLELLHLVSSHPGRTLELSVLVVANAAATGLRFALLRAWVFTRAGASSSKPIRITEVTS